MKIKFFKIKKVYKEENFKIKPNIYWEILMVFSLLLMITSFIFSYNLFMKTLNGDDLVTEGNKNKMSQKEKEKIQSVLEYFSEREKKSIEILNTPSTIIDPSL